MWCDATAIFLSKFHQLCTDDFPQLGIRGQNGFDSGGLSPLVAQLFSDRENLELGELVELDFQNGFGLQVVESKVIHEALRCVSFALRRSDQCNGFIEAVEDFLKALEDVDSFTKLSKVVFEALCEPFQSGNQARFEEWT